MASSPYIKRHYFDKETQKVFWEGMSPDIRAFLDTLEKRETWTYQVDEFESLFLEMATALPKIVQLPLSEEHQTLVEKIIPLLVAMPLRQCVSAVAFLDKHGANDTNTIGWGVVCFLEAKHLSRDKNSDIQLLCKTFCERINTFIRSSICTELFINLNKEKANED